MATFISNLRYIEDLSVSKSVTISTGIPLCLERIEARREKAFLGGRKYGC
jgi:hypothetical protein